MSEQGYNWENCLAYAATSDVGMRRTSNQDSHREVIVRDIDTWYSRGHLFVIADGMGAHAAGELASTQAVEGIRYLYYKHTELSPPEALLKAVQDTNREIHRRGQANVDFHNMGTTCSAMLLLPQGAIIAHVGDSRVYRLRHNVIEQLTFDHSLVWEMRAAGQISDDEAGASGIPKNVITRSLGPRATVQVDLEGPFPVEMDDTFLICSDGLTGRVRDEEIASALCFLPPHEAAKLLAGLANVRGGPDNVTITVVKVISTEIATKSTKAAPLTVGEETEPRAVPYAVWIVLGVSVLASAMMALSNQRVLAAISAACAIIALGAGILLKFSLNRTGKSLIGGHRLGKGPYTKRKRLSEQEFCSRLSQSINDASERLDEAIAGSAANIREYTKQVSLMVDAMKQAQKQRDSAID